MTAKVKNSNLAAAKKTKNDEFYTQWPDIEREMNAYLEYDPADSTTLGHSAHDHLDTRSMLTWTPDPRPLGQAVGAQRRRFALLV